ncbi:uncharacterized protein K444DRAFT_14664 [Hyaloscypha bicolor E]|uniref:Uncharacterized protein n=1 Tax=Hyaloscypha bicolor E TaxID=1095630 RepID=A0A2J6TWJ0_9HELO|nr:uncharacterized protein K444DRAFT_14664 [Hyaloscypha bicolor E]PMD67383.1 hypothetical protein K444DRAFT_14664 [Hyaloscypha bicolor E]
MLLSYYCMPCHGQMPPACPAAPLWCCACCPRVPVVTSRPPPPNLTQLPLLHTCTQGVSYPPSLASGPTVPSPKSLWPPPPPLHLHCPLGNIGSPGKKKVRCSRACVLGEVRGYRRLFHIA